jgi:transcriptional regulator with XRE-family HTH domain
LAKETRERFGDIGGFKFAVARREKERGSILSMFPEPEERERQWMSPMQPTMAEGGLHLTLVDGGASAQRARGGRDARSAQGLGTRLRRERERRHISLEDVACRTKIGMGLLQDLERDDVSRWPGGIYRRGFIRGYAEAVGLDPDLIAREFADAFPIPEREEVSPEGPNAPGSVRRDSPMLRLTLAEGNPGERRRAAVEELSRRILAVLCDAIAIAALGLALVPLAGSIWPALVPLAIAYYGAGVIFTGTTPGVMAVAHYSRRPPHRNAEQFTTAAEARS